MCVFEEKVAGDLRSSRGLLLFFCLSGRAGENALGSPGCGTMSGALYFSFFQGQLESALEQVVALAVQEITKSVGASLGSMLLETASKEQENQRLRARLARREGEKPEGPRAEARTPGLGCPDSLRLEHKRRAVGKNSTHLEGGPGIHQNRSAAGSSKPSARTNRVMVLQEGGSGTQSSKRCAVIAQRAAVRWEGTVRTVVELHK